MLVAKDHKKLLLNLNDPSQVMALIPGAKTVQIKGHDIVSVPHDQDTVRVLRNLGFKAPGPILSYYQWQGQYQPFMHQLDTAEFLTLNQRAFLLNDMGTGKTMSVLWAFDWLRKAGVVDFMVVVSPLSTLERVWADEIFRHFPDMSCGVVHGSPQKRKRMLQDKYDVYVINHDGIKSRETLLDILTIPGRGLLVIDELAEFRNASTDRWKAINVLVNGVRNKKTKQYTVPPRQWVWGLTGTPIPSEPTDAWAQVRLLYPNNVPPYFTKFRDLTMNKVTAHKYTKRFDALETVHRVMQPAIRYSREECIDLPPTTFADREAEMTTDQARVYKDMMAKFKAEYEGGQINAMNEAVKLNKLLQIACGVAYGKHGEEIFIPVGPRLSLIQELIEEAGGKVIIFVPLTGSLESLAEKVGKYTTCRIVQGSTSKGQRDDIFTEFMSPHGFNVLIAQPGCMSHGLSLTIANTIIWYAPINSGAIYQQANARIVRPGQKKNTLIVRIQGSAIERKMYARLENRGTTQGCLLEMFE